MVGEQTMSVILRRWGPTYRILPDEIAAVASYMNMDWPEAEDFAIGLLNEPDGIDLIGWLLQDHVEKARWRCDDEEAARRQEVYQRFLDRCLHCEFVLADYR